MTVGYAFPGPSGVVDSVQLRKDLAGLIIRDASGAARSGILPRHTNALVTSLASMNVAVAAFEAVAVRGGGPLFIANDGVVNVPITTAPVSNSRIDVVYVKQNENGYGGFADGNNNAVLAVAAGTAAASPVKPAIPAGAVELATVLVPAGATTTNSTSPLVVITQTFQYTALTGTPILVRTQADLPTGFGPLTRATTIDTSSSYTYNGTAWAGSGTGWLPWTPTGVSGITNATFVGRAKTISGIQFLAGFWTLNSGFTIADPNFDILGTINPDLPTMIAGNGKAYTPASGTIRSPLTPLVSGTKIFLRYISSATSSIGRDAAITSTLPHGWAVGDRLEFLIHYPI